MITTQQVNSRGGSSFLPFHVCNHSKEHRTPAQKKCSLNTGGFNKWMNLNLKSVVFFSWKIRTSCPVSDSAFGISLSAHSLFCAFLGLHKLLWSYQPHKHNVTERFASYPLIIPGKIWWFQFHCPLRTQFKMCIIFVLSKPTVFIQHLIKYIKGSFSTWFTMLMNSSIPLSHIFL